MRRAVRGIVIKDGNLLVMHRNKFGTEYDTLPGGNIEIGETPEQALAREILEETTLSASNPKLVIIEEAGNPYGTQYIYTCDYVSGEPKLSEGSEEALIAAMGKNLYEPLWLPLADLPDRPFLSEKLKTVLLDSVRSGFPEHVIQIR